MTLPIDIINHILSFRPTHPVACLIKDCIYDFKHADPTKELVLHLFYLHHLIHHKLSIYHKQNRALYSKYQEHFDSMRERIRTGSCIIEAIQQNEHDFLYDKYNTERRSIKNYASFSHDLHHSLICCGMINRDYFHQSTLRLVYNYDDFHNKYRDEIFNHNKIMVKRPSNISTDIYDCMIYDLEQSVVRTYG